MKVSQRSTDGGKVAILGATGFSGEKLVEILLSHPLVDITYLSSRTPRDIYYSNIFPRFQKKTDLKCSPLDIKKAAKLAEVFFLALPHTASMQFVPYLLKNNKKVIDLSADYRLSAAMYKKYYNTLHQDRDSLKRAVYGLSELFKNKIKRASLIANPGCYATSIILPLFPVLKEGIIKEKIIVNSSSSISGAGRKSGGEFHYLNISHNIWAYKPFLHQHIPEIEKTLYSLTFKNIELKFIPHVIGVEAGIYSTIYGELKKKISSKVLEEIYKKYYGDSTFIRLTPHIPKLKDVVGTNFCDIGFVINNKDIAIFSCLDNLIKGAAGQAVQNMNIMMGWNEDIGLIKY